MYTEKEKIYIKELESRLRNKSKMKFTGNKQKFTDLKELLEYILTRKRTKKNGFFVPSTLNIKNNIIEKGLGSRTFDNIYRIILYYKPETTIKEVIDILKIMNINKMLAKWVCNDINKLVMVISPDYAKSFKLNGKIKI